MPISMHVDLSHPKILASNSLMSTGKKFYEQLSIQFPFIAKSVTLLIVLDESTYVIRTEPPLIDPNYMIMTYDSKEERIALSNIDQYIDDLEKWGGING